MPSGRASQQGRCDSVRQHLECTAECC
jgi:hypothetical protein